MVATGLVEANGLFEVSLTVDLEPGERVLEIISQGARALVTCTVEPPDEVAVPAITVEPGSGSVCSLLTVRGTDYRAGDRVSISVGGTSLGSAVTVDDSGEFELVSSVPDIGAGPSRVTARRGADPEADPVDFEVTEGRPNITVMPGAGEPGSSIKIGGSGFAPGDRLEMTLAGAPLSGVDDVRANGTFSTTARVPNVEAGTYPVEVAGGCAAIDPAVEFTVGPSGDPPPIIFVDPGQGETGDLATVNGERYRPGDLVDITFDGITFASNVEVGADGTFERRDVVPEGIEPGQIEVAAARGQAPEADTVPFTVLDGCWWEILGICWYWWLLFLLLLLLFLWLLLWLWCRRRYPFHPGEEIQGSGWVACEDECDCRYRQGRCVSEGGDCPDGCSCELFRRKVWRSDGCWERVPQRQERFTWCYRCACARPLDAATELEG